MGKKRSSSKADKPRFKYGDRVRYRFGDELLDAVVVEDRGNLGIGGRRLYGIRFYMSPDYIAYSEEPAEDLVPIPKSPPNEAEDARFEQLLLAGRG
jgi:hypothetical protein